MIFDLGEQLVDGRLCFFRSLATESVPLFCSSVPRRTSEKFALVYMVADRRAVFVMLNHEKRRSNVESC